MNRSVAPRRRTGLVSLASGLSVAVLVGVLVTMSGLPGSSQRASADTSSAKTIAAASQDADIADSPFPGLKVTVSQTDNLVSQGVTISWTGAKQSTLPNNSTGGEDFLQIAQCWGDDTSATPGPDRTTCQYGAFLTPGATRDSFVTDDSVAPEDAQYTAPSTNFAVPTYTSIPFKAVPPTGSTTSEVISSVDNNVKTNVNVNTNKFFTQYTSNEVPWAGSGSDGSGSVKFEIQTALTAPGLGCGTPVTAADGTVTGRSCWLVLIPRGEADAGDTHITKSGLFWPTWKHRVAFKLGFRPLGITCAIGADERQVSGSELAATAIASWQPALCSASGGAAYTLSTGTESDALTAASTQDGAALALTSRALVSDSPDPNAYAPIALTGISLTFAIDEVPTADDSTPADVAARAGLAVDSIKLTPRLVAKLLTNSYLDSLPPRVDKSYLGFTSSANPGHNARNLTKDPEFLSINGPEWQHLTIISPGIADMLEPQGRSDIAYQLWQYVLSSPDAVAFLAGKPDPWGMIVNPWSLTTSANPAGSPFVLPTDSFPKADPSEQAATASGGVVNLVTWRPYVNDFDTAAYLTLRGDGQVLNTWDPTKTPAQYLKPVRSLPGNQAVLGISDTSAAAKYQVLSAALLNPAGNYVLPTTDSLTAAAAAMTVSTTQPQMSSLDLTSAAAKAAPTAYPLAMPVYAATNPTLSDAATRADYAAFIRYASTTGQTPGAGVGQLPDGYAPIPAGWASMAATAATNIEAGTAMTPPVDTADDPGSDSGSGFGDSSGGGFGDASGGDPSGGAASGGSPTATGNPATLLAGATPKDPDSGAIPAALPASLFGGLLAAGAVPIIGRVRRRP